MHEIFISYCRHDSDAANALADTLSKAGLSVWLDRKAIQEGDAFDTQIEEAIAQTRVVIVIWSEHSVKSHWVRAEAAYALGKHKLLPISIDPIRAASAVHADSNDRFPLLGSQQQPCYCGSAGCFIFMSARCSRSPAALRTGASASAAEFGWRLAAAF
jgi:hypothetical protein